MRGGAICAAALLGIVLAGCTGVPTAGERQARKQAQSVAESYRSNPPALPTLTPDSELGDYLRFAMLNNPQVEAGYYDWVGSIERITQQRSLPDPRLTFEFYVADIVTSVMPGLMMDFPGPGKLTARANVATAESQGKFYLFQTQALQAAFALKKAFYQVYFLDEKIRVNRETLGLLADLEYLARAQNKVGKVTLQDVLRAQIEQDRVRTGLANLEDSRGALLAQFKAALGVRPDQADPPVPKRAETTTLDLTPDKLLEQALTQNPRIKAMEADVRRGEALFRVAQKEKIPDFSAGFEVDVKPSPAIWNPQFAMTLPIWRDKIAAQIAEAQAAKSSAQARLTAEQIALATDLAEKSFMFRQATRNSELLRDLLLPKARQSFDVARIAYLSGQLDFFNLSDAQKTLLGFELDAVSAQEQRELALAELSLLIVGSPPHGAPAAFTNAR